MTMTDSGHETDFERRLANAMHRLAPADDEDGADATDVDADGPRATVVPLRTGRRRRVLALAASASAVAAAAVAVLVVTLAGADDSGVPAAGPDTPSAEPMGAVAACTQLTPTAGPLHLRPGHETAYSLVTLRNTSAEPCRVRSTPSVQIVLRGIASLHVPPATTRPALPVRLTPGTVATLRIDYAKPGPPATQTKWRIFVRLPGGAATSTSMTYPREGVVPLRVSVVRAG